MLPIALAIPTPIPSPLDATLEFGPVLLLIVLLLLAIGALAALRAAVVARRTGAAGQAPAVQGNIRPLQRPGFAARRAPTSSSPSRAA
jgi:hypothetical protein